MRRTQTLLFPVLLLAAEPARAGGIIGDRAYFAFLTHSLIDFETRADGTDPFDGLAGESTAMPRDEYISSGVVFASTANPSWGRVFRDGAQDVLAAGGSPTTFVGAGGGSDPFAFEFIIPVRAFGIFALSDRLEGLPPPEPSGLRIFGDDGSILGEIFLRDDLLDGQIELIEFGFMGYEAPPGRTIARVEVIRNSRFGFDDLFFSPVPAPTTTAPLLLGALALARRRR